MTLDDLLAAARALPSKLLLVFVTNEGPTVLGYHVTELKPARIISIDCGARVGCRVRSALRRMWSSPFQLLLGAVQVSNCIAGLCGVQLTELSRTVWARTAADPLAIETSG